MKKTRQNSTVWFSIRLMHAVKKQWNVTNNLGSNSEEITVYCQSNLNTRDVSQEKHKRNRIRSNLAYIMLRDSLPNLIGSPAFTPPFASWIASSHWLISLEPILVRSLQPMDVRDVIWAFAYTPQQIMRKAFRYLKFKNRDVRPKQIHRKTTISGTPSV